MTPATVGALAIAFCISIVFGYAIAASLLSPPLRRLAPVFAPGVGLGFCSLLLFLVPKPMFLAESVLLIAAVWYLYRHRYELFAFSYAERLPAFAVVLCVALGLALAGLIIEIHRMPHGDWDAWAIWNTHARVLYLDAADWKNDIRYSFHNDYPLLTPLIADRFWQFAGFDVPEAGALAGLVFGLSAVLVLAVTVSQSRGLPAGVLLALVLLGTPFFLDSASSQYADVPLAFFILSTISLLCLYTEDESDYRILALAGFTAGCAGWTKNEGMLFIGVTTVALLLPILRNTAKVVRRFLAFSAGLALPLATILFFKTTILGRNDLIANQNSTFIKMVDFDRHSFIAERSLTALPSFGHWSVAPWIALLLFIVFQGFDRRFNRNFGWVTGTTIVVLLLAGYYFVYLVTPLDLKYHMESSIDRLLIQVWPSFLLLVGLLGPVRASSKV